MAYCQTTSMASAQVMPVQPNYWRPSSSGLKPSTNEAAWAVPIWTSRRPLIRVPHVRLLKKCKAYRICGRIHAWLTSFLIGRKQRVSVGGMASPWRDVLSGIPQGSVLGLLLFILYINDMPDMVKSLIKLFAGDTKVYSRTDDLDRCKKDAALVDWSRTWQLLTNARCCEYDVDRKASSIG